MLSVLQAEAVDAWRQGKNVRIVAVPGAGKSRVLLEACKVATGNCLILAYDRELCLETKARIIDMELEGRVMCLTFHGLATMCIAPTYDDIALADVLDSIDDDHFDDFEILEQFEHILIDEAQDFRPNFQDSCTPWSRHRTPRQYMDSRRLQPDALRLLRGRSGILGLLGTSGDHFVSAREWQTVSLQ